MPQGKVFNSYDYFMVIKTKANWKSDGNQIIPKFVAQHKYSAYNETNLGYRRYRLYWFAYSS
jgi:hypothetical protein